MIHPSYKELMEVVNKDVQEGEEPVITSRYSIVLATAKRARQIISRQTSGDTDVLNNVAKPLSKAVKELYEGKIRILPENQELASAQQEVLTEESKENETGETV